MYVTAKHEKTEQTLTPYQAVKITVTFAQILSSFFYTFTLRSIPWPVLFVQYLGKLSIFALLSFLQVPNIACALHWRFYGEFASFALLPALCLLFALLVNRVCQALRRAVLRAAAWCRCLSCAKNKKKKKTQAEVVAPASIVGMRCP